MLIGAVHTCSCPCLRSPVSFTLSYYCINSEHLDHRRSLGPNKAHILVLLHSATLVTAVEYSDCDREGKTLDGEHS